MSGLRAPTQGLKLSAPGMRTDISASSIYSRDEDGNSYEDLTKARAPLARIPYDPSAFPAQVEDYIVSTYLPSSPTEDNFSDSPGPGTFTDIDLRSTARATQPSSSSKTAVASNNNLGNPFDVTPEEDEEGPVMIYGDEAYQLEDMSHLAGPSTAARTNPDHHRDRFNQQSRNRCFVEHDISDARGARSASSSVFALGDDGEPYAEITKLPSPIPLDLDEVRFSRAAEMEAGKKKTNTGGKQVFRRFAAWFDSNLDNLWFRVSLLLLFVIFVFTIGLLILGAELVKSDGFAMTLRFG